MRTFSEILEKRVRNIDKTDCDFYTIEKAAKGILEDMFGKAGVQNIQIKHWKKPVLFVFSNKSLWKSELLLNKNVFLEKINKKVCRDQIKEIKFTN